MKRVLVAPLDWGLGHASRCIPLIRLLLDKKAQVIIAGSGRSLELLRIEFPSLKFYNLVPYDPQYPSQGSMVMKMAKQLPRFLSTIKKEHVQIEEIVVAEKIDVVISDNRFGCWSSRAKSVFITHQSNILMPKRFGWLGTVVRKMNYRAMKKFSICWIPDFPGGESLSGKLSGFRDDALNIRYIGILSRFSTRQRIEKPAPHIYNLLCIFSGPEPQRTLLENLVVRELETVSLKVAIVRGVPLSEGIESLKVNADVFDFADTKLLEELIHDSEIVLARSGFSTVMDLATLRKKAIFVPTPGQTEQEYLAQRMQEQRVAYSISQKNFNLAKALKNADVFEGFTHLKEDASRLHQAIDEILSDEKIL